MPYRSISALIEGKAAATIAPEASVRQAAVIMTDRRIGALPVIRQGKLLGIFTERDMVSRVVASGLDVDKTPVETVMTSQPETIDLNRPLYLALDIMHERGFRHLPVVDDERVVGMLSMRDVPAEYRVMRNNWVSAKSGELKENNYQI
jgi:CBS domain-containing protein